MVADQRGVPDVSARLGWRRSRNAWTDSTHLEKNGAAARKDLLEGTFTDAAQLMSSRRRQSIYDAPTIDAPTRSLLRRAPPPRLASTTRTDAGKQFPRGVPCPRNPNSDLSFHALVLFQARRYFFLLLFAVLTMGETGL